jgi:hypothetical protein
VTAEGAIRRRTARSSDTCSAFVGCTSVATPTPLLCAEAEQAPARRACKIAANDPAGAEVHASLELPLGSDDLGNYTGVSANFSSSRLWKSGPSRSPSGSTSAPTCSIHTPDGAQIARPGRFPSGRFPQLVGRRRRDRRRPSQDRPIRKRGSPRPHCCRSGSVRACIPASVRQSGGLNVTAAGEAELFTRRRLGVVDSVLRGLRPPSRFWFAGGGRRYRARLPQVSPVARYAQRGGRLPAQRAVAIPALRIINASPTDPRSRFGSVCV